MGKPVQNQEVESQPQRKLTKGEQMKLRIQKEREAMGGLPQPQAPAANQAPARVEMEIPSAIQMEMPSGKENI